MSLNARSWRGKSVRRGRLPTQKIFLAATCLTVLIASVILSYLPAFADPNAYSYYATIGTIASSGTPGNGTLVNPSMVSYSNGNIGDVYVYNNTAYPSATTRIISVFNDVGTTGYPWSMDITIDISNFSSVPQGMTVDENGVIYITAPNNGLVAEYVVPSSYTAGTVIHGTPIGSTTALGQVLGSPSIDQTSGTIVLGGEFHGTGANIGLMYGMAHLPPGSNSSTYPDIMIQTNNNTDGNTYTVNNVVAAPSGTHYATGWFQIGGQSYNIIRINSDESVTPIAPPNVSGLTEANIYTITSVNVDDQNNIYLSGSFGIVANGQWSAASLLKLDPNGNFLTYVTTQGSAQDQVGQLNNTNMVSINTHNQRIYVLDTNNNALKVFSSDANTNLGGDTQPIVAPVFPSVDVNTCTMTFQTSQSYTVTTTNALADTLNTDTPLISTSFFVPGTQEPPAQASFTASFPDSSGNIVTTSAATGIVGTATSFTAVSTTPDGNNETGTGTYSTDGDVTTGTTTLTSPDGTIANITVTMTTIYDSGTPIGTQFIFDMIVTFPDSTVRTKIFTSDPDGTVTVVFPSCLPGTNYESTAVVTNGITSSPISTIDWSTPSLASLSLSANPISFSNNPATNSGIGTGSTIVSAQSSDPSGYTISIRGSNAVSGAPETDSNNLICSTTPSAKYTPSSGTALSPSALAVNTWGYQPGASAITSGWIGITATDAVFASSAAATGPSNDGEAPDNYTLWFGARADYSTPACSYNGQVIITLIVGSP